MSVDRQKAFENAIKEIGGKFKDIPMGTINDFKNLKVETISTGSLVLDSIIGGGLGKGRIIEIFGSESSGKTSMALTAIGNVQKEGGTGVFLDVEQALDISYAQKLGVDVDKLVVSQPSIAEDVLNMINALCNSGAVDIIVVDSVASMVPRAESEQDIGKHTIGLLARLMSQALKQIAKSANENNCTVIFLNQTRANVGVMYGPKKVTAGGNSLKFYASQRIEVKRKEKVEENGEVIGTKVLLKCVKNKLGIPFLEGLTILTFNKGINQSAEIMELAQELGVIEVSGRTQYYTPTEKQKYIDYSGFNSVPFEDKIKIGTSKADVQKELNENKALFEMISEMVIKKLKQKQGVAEEEKTETSDDNKSNKKTKSTKKDEKK